MTPVRARVWGSGGGEGEGVGGMWWCRCSSLGLNKSVSDGMIVALMKVNHEDLEIYFTLPVGSLCVLGHRNIFPIESVSCGYVLIPFACMYYHTVYSFALVATCTFYICWCASLFFNSACYDNYYIILLIHKSFEHHSIRVKHYL